ncbi:hypothetical protein C1I97_02330 [Streptomyces sp. NTH33]|uniref:hypothetical protein n=1 Tax=Streptomyces sp. NTH33 TaxID=1735453 RepID=UPI000DA79397|nr:hypothetical protein [Streptomyces sp. NTH33]PZH19678.1 hypothetical protein C1I97_02330 [Streptomyces sp. NTH33]
MTTATRATRVSSAVRIASVGLLGALALTACDSGGSDSKGGATATPSASASASASASTSTSENNGVNLDGSWLATADGRAVVLIVTGKQAALFSTDRTRCTGTIGEEGGKHVFHLGTCKARTSGTVESVNKTTLRVTWEGGLGEETYTRSEGPALPPSLPTASLGS